MAIEEDVFLGTYVFDFSIYEILKSIFHRNTTVFGKIIHLKYGIAANVNCESPAKAEIINTPGKT